MLLFFWLLTVGSTYTLEIPSYYKYVLNNESAPYDITQSPYEITRKRVTIEVKPDLLMLLEVPDLRETVTYHMSYTQRWEDHRLAFDPKIFGDEIVLPSNLIWQPLVACDNCISVKSVEEANERLVYIQPSGLVITARHINMEIVLKKQSSRAFPYNIKKASIVLRTDYSHRFILNVKPIGAIYDVPEWNLTTSEVESIGDVRYAKIPISLKRNPAFYEWTLLAPTALVTDVVLAGLILPGSSNLQYRFGTCLTGIVSLAILFAVVDKYIPKSAELQTIAKVILFQMAMTTAPLIFNRLFRIIKSRLRVYLTSKVIRRIYFLIFFVISILGPWAMYHFEL